jgi:hypothetical protein
VHALREPARARIVLVEEAFEERSGDAQAIAALARMSRSAGSRGECLDRRRIDAAEQGLPRSAASTALARFGIAAMPP